jgi:hypothetical protein
LGRWINRDPKNERGGFNLYAFIRNNVASLVDPYGLIGFVKDEMSPYEQMQHQQWELWKEVHWNNNNTDTEVVITTEVKGCVNEDATTLGELIKSVGVNTVNSSAEIVTLRQFINKYGINAQCRISVTNGRKYLIVRPTTLKNQIIKGTRFGILNPKVADLAGMAGMKVHPATTSIIVLTTLSVDITQGLITKENLSEIGVNTAVDLATNFVSFGSGWVATYLTMKVGAAAGTTVSPGVGTAVGIVAGISIGVALDVFVTPQVKEKMIRELEPLLNEVIWEVEDVKYEFFSIQNDPNFWIWFMNNLRRPY